MIRLLRSMWCETFGHKWSKKRRQCHVLYIDCRRCGAFARIWMDTSTDGLSSNLSRQQGSGHDS